LPFPLILVNLKNPLLSFGKKKAGKENPLLSFGKKKVGKENQYGAITLQGETLVAREPTSPLQ